MGRAERPTRAGDLTPVPPDSQGRRYTFLTMPDGDRVRLPLHFEPNEFGLPGNSETHVGGRVVALFDGVSETGAILDTTAPVPYWTILQPTSREFFFGEQVRFFVEERRRLGLFPSE